MVIEKQKKKNLDVFLKRLKTNDELILILKNLMWLKSEIRWEGALLKYRNEGYDKELQELIHVITVELLQEIKETVEKRKSLK